MDETPLSSPIALPIANADETPPLQITFPSESINYVIMILQKRRVRKDMIRATNMT